MGRNWTAAQLAAMNTRGRTLLISAAAGSGKTATLTERIIRRLTDENHPGDISRMLIVTFTRAAAAELRERISAALNAAIETTPDSRHLQDQLLRLGAAHICTIDAFCMEPLKAHFADLGLPASFRIADETELEPLCEQVMNDLIDRFYRDYAPSAEEGDSLFSMLEQNDFADLCDALTPANQDHRLSATLRGVYMGLLNYPEGLERLRTDAESLQRESDCDFLATRTGSALRAYVEEFCRSATAFYTEALETLATEEKALQKWGETYTYEADFIRRLAAAEGYAAVRDCLRSFDTPRLGTIRGQSPELKALKARRETYKDTIEKMQERFFLISAEDVAVDMRRMARMCEVLYELLSAYDREVTSEKCRRGICDFTDNRRNLLKLLQNPNGTPSPIALEYAERFDEVYIDEYQDVDAVQDTIFRLIGGNHRFMVGDIKQSIYTFRGADPSVFAGYRRRLPPLGSESTDSRPSAGNSIFMSENFRCDEPVIRVTNGICGHLFRACPDSIGYTAADDLGFAKLLPEGYAPPRVQIDVLYKEKSRARAEGDEETVKQPEFVHIANCIAGLLREGVLKADGTPIRPEDIAILMRSKTHFRELTSALAAAGIPVGCHELEEVDAGRDLLHGADMTYLVDLLRVLDDPDRDTSLAEVLRAPFPGFTLEELITARQAGDGSLYAGLCALADRTDSAQGEVAAYKAADFLRWLEGYRALCTTLTAEGILRLLRQDERVSARTGQAFLFLYDTARTVRTGSFVGVYDFLQYVEKRLKSNTATPAEQGDRRTGSVSVMSIHKSKGLEFPVVFVAQCGATEGGHRLPDMVFSPDCGLGMKLFCRAEHRKYTTTPYRAVSLAISRQEREDAIRVLYVAMTRARERLYLVGTGGEELPPPFPVGDRFATLSATCFLDWICAAYAAHPELSAYADLHQIPVSAIRPCDPLPRRAEQTAAPDEKTIATRDYYRRLAAEVATPSATEALLRSLPTKVPASRMVEDMVDRCVYLSSDMPLGDEDKLPESERGLGGCDPRTSDAIRESIRLLHAAGEDELELLLAENRKPTAAERGTAAHLFLQFCHYDRVLRDGVEAEITRLLADGFLNRRTAAILDRACLKAFFKSRLFTEMQTATAVRREFRFARFVPMASLTKNPALREALQERTLYVQGSIDLLCEYPDGRITVTDYKTDRVSRAEREDPSLLATRLGELYGSQLRQYAAAVREIYGREPDALYIYSLPLGEAIPISVRTEE